MSIIDKGTIDMIGKSKTNDTVIIGITDHLQWDSDNIVHLDMLLHKLNVIIDYVLGGQIKEKYSDWEKNDLEIRLMFKYQPPKDIMFNINDFETKIKQVIKKSKINIMIG